VQLAPAASGPPQVFVCEKSPALVPPTKTLMIVALTVLVFVTVTVWAADGLPPTAMLPNDKVAGSTVSVGATPVPLSVTVCGLFGAVSVMISDPLCAPAEVGLNCTWMGQDSPGSSVPTQVCD